MMGFLKTRGKLILIIVLVLVFIALVFFIFYGPLKKQPTTTIKENSTSTTTTKNETEDVVYKEAQEQVFPSKTSNKTGALIVTSVPEGASVIIDAPAAEGPTNYPKIPDNTTPFMFSEIPEGNYIYSAIKDGYDLSEGMIEVKEGETTRLNIYLYLLETVE